VLGTVLVLFLVEHNSRASLQGPAGGGQSGLQQLRQREHMTLQESFQQGKKTIEGKSKNKSKNREER
jgi:hypothetical protein